MARADGSFWFATITLRVKLGAIGMIDPTSLLAEYDSAIDRHGDVCAADPARYHAPEAEVFRSLRPGLVALAEQGDARGQYALASILWLGLCYESEEEHQRNYSFDILEASRWWSAAAAQGPLGAFDNLICCGVGDLADRSRVALRAMEAERPDLVPRANGMPVYQAAFFAAVWNREFL